MDLDEYMWRNKITNRKFGLRIGTHAQHVSTIKRKVITPSLMLAAKIIEASDGKVEMFDLMSDRDRKKYNDWKKAVEEKEND